MLFLILETSSICLAQRAELGFHVNVNKGNRFRFESDNYSIDPLNTLGLQGGINYTFLSMANWGVRGGLDVGYYTDRYQILDGFQHKTFTHLYNGPNAEFVYRFNIGGKQMIETFGGYMLRLYYPIKLSTAGSANGVDYRVFKNETFGHTQQSNVYLGFMIRHNFSERHAVSIGLTKNFGLEKFSQASYSYFESNKLKETNMAFAVTNNLGVRVMYSFLQKRLL